VLEDIEATIAQYEKQSTAQQCEAVIFHLDNVVRHARRLAGRAHALLEQRIGEERQAELEQRPAGFPTAQKIGA
jgi:hypothetical protein